jgi:tape measure domain-containing protein
MSLSLGTLEIGLGLNTAQYDSGIKSAKDQLSSLEDYAQKITRDMEWSLKQSIPKLTIVPSVDHRPLHGLNKHLSEKGKHIDQVSKKVIKIKVDDSELQEIANKTVIVQAKVQSKSSSQKYSNEIKQTVEVSIKNANLELLTEIKAVTKEIREVVKAVSRLKPTAIGTISNSLIQGIGFNLTKSFSQGFEQSFTRKTGFNFESAGQKTGDITASSVQFVQPVLNKLVDTLQIKIDKITGRDKPIGERILTASETFQKIQTKIGVSNNNPYAQKSIDSSIASFQNMLSVLGSGEFSEFPEASQKAITSLTELLNLISSENNLGELTKDLADLLKITIAFSGKDFLQIIKQSHSLLKTQKALEGSSAEFIGALKQAVSEQKIIEQGFRLIARENHKSFFVNDEGKYIGTDNVGGRVIGFTATPKQSIPGVGQDIYEIAFSLDSRFSSLGDAAQLTKKEVIQLKNSVSEFFNKFVSNTNEAILTASPENVDQKGKRRGSIYQRFGFVPEGEDNRLVAQISSRKIVEPNLKFNLKQNEQVAQISKQIEQRLTTTLGTFDNLFQHSISQSIQYAKSIIIGSELIQQDLEQLQKEAQNAEYDDSPAIQAQNRINQNLKNLQARVNQSKRLQNDPILRDFSKIDITNINTLVPKEQLAKIALKITKITENVPKEIVEKLLERIAQFQPKEIIDPTLLGSIISSLTKDIQTQLTGVTPQLKMFGSGVNSNYLNLLPEKKRASFLKKQTEYEQALIKYEQTDNPEAKIPTPPQLSKIDKQTIAKNLRIEDIQREVSYVIQNANTLRKASQDAIDRVNNLLAKVPKNERFGHPLASLKGNLTQLKESAENVNPIYDLKKLGVNKEILDAINVKSQVIPEMADAGSSIVSGLMQGLNSKLAELETVSIDIASIPLEITKQINKIQSPSKEFEKIGKNIVEGEIKGIKSKEKDLQATMAIIAKNMIENLYLATKNPVNIDPFFPHPQSSGGGIPPIPPINRPVASSDPEPEPNKQAKSASKIIQNIDNPTQLQKIGKVFEVIKNQLNNLPEPIKRVLLGARTLLSAFAGFQILQQASMFFRQFTTDSFEAALNMERLETALDFSTENAESSLAKLKIQADRLGLSFLSSAKNYQQFSASTINTPLEFQKDKIFEGITLGLATRGASSQQQDRALLAITQIASKGRVSMEELNSQLGEAMPGALQIAARSMGLTSQEFIKLVESGSILAEDLLPKLATQINLESAGGLSVIDDTAFAQVARVQNQIELLRISLGESLLNASKLGLPLITKGLEILTKHGQSLATVLTSISIVTVGSFVMVLKNLGLIDLTLKALGVTAKTTGGAISQIGVGLLKGLGWTALIFGVMEAFKGLYQYINAGSEESKRSLKSTQESLQELRRLLEKPLPTSTVITDSATAIQQFKNNREKDKSLEFTAGGLSDTTQILRLSTDTFSDTRITEFTGKLDTLRQKAKDLKVDEIIASGDADVKKATSVRQEIAKVNQEIQALTEKYFPQIGLIVNEIASTEERITAIKKVLDDPESSKFQKDNASIQLEVAEAQLRKLKESQEKYNEAVKENLVNYQRLTEQINKVARALSNIEFISNGRTILSETNIKRQVLSGNLKRFEIDLVIREQSLSIVKDQFNSLNELLATKEKELQNTLTDQINQRITELMPELNGLDFRTALQQGIVSPEAIGDRLQQLGDQAPFELKQVLEAAKQQASIRRQTLTIDKSIVDTELEIANARRERARNARQASIVGANVNERIATLRQLPLGGPVASYRDALSEVRNQERLLEEAYHRLESASDDPNVIQQEVDNTRLALEQARANLLQQQTSLQDYYRNLDRQIIDFNRQIEDYRRQIEDAQLSAFKENRSLSESYSDLVRELDKNLLNAQNQLLDATDRIRVQQVKNRLLIPGTSDAGKELGDIFLEFVQGQADIASRGRTFQSRTEEIETSYISTLRNIRNLQEQQQDAERNRLRTIEDIKRTQENLNRTLADLIRQTNKELGFIPQSIKDIVTNLNTLPEPIKLINSELVAIPPNIKTSGEDLVKSIEETAEAIRKAKEGLILPAPSNFIPAPVWNGGSFLPPPPSQLPSNPNRLTRRGQELSQHLDNPRVKAFLDTIAYAEGTANMPNKGYNTLFGHGQFSSLATHPNIHVPFGNTTSTAAGRYQALNFVWDEEKVKLGLKDFSPISQDLLALSRISMRGGLDELLEGDIRGVINAVSKEWASFPGANYPGQGMKRMEDLLNFYQQSLRKYQPNATRTTAELEALQYNDSPANTGAVNRVRQIRRNQGGQGANVPSQSPVVPSASLQLPQNLQKGSNILVRKSGRRTPEGLEILQFDLIKNGKVVDTVIGGVTGRPSTQSAIGTNRTNIRGSETPLPDGNWSIDANHASRYLRQFNSGQLTSYKPSQIPLGTVGPAWIGAEPKFSTGRSQIGFHLDDLQLGSAGCLVFTDPNQIAKIANWVVQSGANSMFVDLDGKQTSRGGQGGQGGPEFSSSPSITQELPSPPSIAQLPTLPNQNQDNFWDADLPPVPKDNLINFQNPNLPPVPNLPTANLGDAAGQIRAAETAEQNSQEFLRRLEEQQNLNNALDRLIKFRQQQEEDTRTLERTLRDASENVADLTINSKGYLTVQEEINKSATEVSRQYRSQIESLEDQRRTLLLNADAMKKRSEVMKDELRKELEINPNTPISVVEETTKAIEILAKNAELAKERVGILDQAIEQLGKNQGVATLEASFRRTRDTVRSIRDRLNDLTIQRMKLENQSRPTLFDDSAILTERISLQKDKEELEDFLEPYKDLPQYAEYVANIRSEWEKLAELRLERVALDASPNRGAAESFFSDIREGKGIESAFGSLGLNVVTKFVEGITKPAIDALTLAIDGFTKPITQAFESVFNAIIGPVGNFFTNALSSIFKPVSNIFSSIFGGSSGGGLFNGLLSGITGIFSGGLGGLGSIGSLGSIGASSFASAPASAFSLGTGFSLFSDGGKVGKPNAPIEKNVISAFQRERAMSGGRKPRLIVANEDELVLNPKETEAYLEYRNNAPIKNYANGGFVGGKPNYSTTSNNNNSNQSLVINNTNNVTVESRNDIGYSLTQLKERENAQNERTKKRFFG